MPGLQLCLSSLSALPSTRPLPPLRSPNSIDPALRRFGRFDREIDIGVPDEVGDRVMTMCWCCGQRQVQLERTKHRGCLARLTCGLDWWEVLRTCTHPD